MFRHSFLAARLWGRPRHLARPENIDAYLELGEAILRRMSAACEASGVPITVVNVCVAGTLEAIARQPKRRANLFKMRRSLAELQVDVVDEIDFLASSYRAHGARMVAPRAHWSAIGNCMLARRVATAMFERGFPAVEPAPDCLAQTSPSD